jgi:recombinational DNA repair protein RecR
MTPLLRQLVVLTTGVGALMVLLGLGQGLLKARSGSRRCPSCGRLIDGRVCKTCTGTGR